MANSIAYLASEVYNVTRRPDLTNQTAQAIRTATLMLHQRAFYPKDLQEFFIDFEEVNYLQQFQYETYVPFWRALSYFKHLDYRYSSQLPVAPNACFNQFSNKEFNIITPDNIFDYFGGLKTNVAYLSGINWNMRASFPFQKVRCGCYLNPNVTNDGYSSWIADKHEFAVVYEAARLIFNQIGLDAEQQVMQNNVATQVAIIDTANLVGVGG